MEGADIVRLVLFLTILLSSCAGSARSLSECRFDRSIQTLDQLIESATGVYLVEAEAFEPARDAEFGTYTLKVISARKGNEKRVEIVGRAPPLEVPQYYFDATLRHSRYKIEDLNANFGRFVEYQKLGSSCTTYPDFVISYRYLLFIGIDHELAFEPINSTLEDKWFQAVLSRTRYEAK